MDIYQRTVILAAVIAIGLVVLSVFRNSGKIRQAVAGSYFRSTCCGATSTPYGWTQDGWVSTCDTCGAWQYLGDDYDNPPAGFIGSVEHWPDLNLTGVYATGGVISCQCGYPNNRTEHDVTCPMRPFLVGEISRRGHYIHDHILSSRRPAPRPAANGPESIAPDSGPTLRRYTNESPPLGDVRCGLGDAIMPELLRPRGFEINKPNKLCTCPADERPPVCQHRYALSDCQASFETEVDRLVAGFRERHPEIAAMWDGGCGLCGGELEHMPDCPKGALIDMAPDQDEGEGELVMPPPPNIGGEGHPDYQGPHYDTPHDRFVPYDVLRDPEPDAAVHIVGNAAFAGPLPEDKPDEE